MEQNHGESGPSEGDPQSQLVPVTTIDIHPHQSFDGTEVKIEQAALEPVNIEQVFEASKDPKVEPGEEEVQVIYLNVPETEEPQVLDLSSLLAQQGIQVVDQSELQTVDAKDGGNIFRAEDIVIEEGNGGGNITVIAASQSEAQSAHALLNLANAQAEGSSVQVSDILAAQRQAQEDEENATSAKALLQLAADQNTGTYIVDETGTMIPLSDVRGESVLPVEDTGVTTIAICQCFCGREFISQEDLERHKAAHKFQRRFPAASQSTGNGTQTCTLCSAQYPSTRELMQHHKDAHPGEMPWECDVCGKRYHKKIAMKAHMRVHNTMAKYQCSLCKKVFFYKSAMTRHIKQHTCEKPFKCTICGEMLNTLWELRKHRINHQVRSLFHCDICSKVFKQKATLVVHSRVHTGQRPYACDICSKSFSLKSTLTQHRRIHTGEKPNICPICNQRFRQASTMQSHMKRHTHDKPFICRYCRMRFAYQDEVTEHELEHAHNKKWQCDECGMRFKNQSLLARHCRRHTNERPFVCEVCNKSFVQSGSLRAHMRSHTNEKPYYCRMCSKAYATSGTLLLHIRKVHNLAAKTVKEVFPVYKYIEDQKVFTIRNKPLVGSETVVNSEGMNGTGDRVTVVVDENMEITTTTSTVQETSDKDKSDSPSDAGDKTTAGPENGAVVAVTTEADLNTGSIGNDTDAIATSSDELSVTKQVESPAGTVTTLTMPEAEAEPVTTMAPLGDVWGSHGDGSEPVQVAAEVDVSSHSLHSAQDRQEAALGLAELSLFGAGAATGSNSGSADVSGSGMPSVQHAQKTKTFFKEEEEDENDPNVTKIILSKEGGVMNSQDPHQCPICHRIFGRKSIMVEHLRIHTDEKPYECDYCSAGFRQNAQLRSHIRNRHTRVERYQCSFCHNRFLSPSITIRHIKFHHKLKMKFCQEANPDWTINSAVWCDDKFEFNIEDPQFLKVGKKNKASGKKSKRDLDLTNAREESVVAPTGVPDGSQEAVVPTGGQQTFVVKVCDNGQVSATEMAVQTTTGTGTISQDSSVTVTTSEEGTSTEPPAASASARTVGTLTYATPGGRDRAGEAGGTAVSLADSDYVGSQLICGTCKMQFSSVSNLRAHLREVHNTTLAESDVSYVFEDYEGHDQQQVQLESIGNAEGLDNTAATEGSEQSQVQQQMSDGQQEVVTQDVSSEVTCRATGTQDKRRSSSAMVNRDAECLNICRMCSQGFFYRNDLDQHMKSHTEEEVESVGMHRCDTCLLVLKNTQEVAKHIQRCHGVSKIFSCSICDKEFFQESSVYRHMKFFHKWEIKIRGEINIPVIVKPAAQALQRATTRGTPGFYMPKTRRKVGRVGKFLPEITAVSSEVDPIIGRVTETHGGLSSSEKEAGTSVTIDLPSHDLNQPGRSGSLAGSDSEKKSPGPSFIIVKDGSLGEEGYTQKIVDKLMALFKSKADAVDSESKKLPKIVKVTTVGFDPEEMNSITEVDINEALSQLEDTDEKDMTTIHVAPEEEKLLGDVISVTTSTETHSQSKVVQRQHSDHGDEQLKGKGYITTLQGKKKVGSLEPSASKAAIVKEEICEEISKGPPEGDVDTVAEPASSVDREASTSEPSQMESAHLMEILSSPTSSRGLSTPIIKSHKEKALPVLDRNTETEASESSLKVTQEKLPPVSVRLERLVDDATSFDETEKQTVERCSSGKQGLETEGKASSKTPEKSTIISKLSATSPLEKTRGLQTRSAQPAQNLSDPDDTGASQESLPAKNKVGSPAPGSTGSTPKKVDNPGTGAGKAVNTVSGAKNKSKVTTASDKEKAAVAVGQKVAKSKAAAASLEKKMESVEPLPERRSSSGRLIKRKMFGDEIEDMSPIRKRKK